MLKYIFNLIRTVLYTK